MFHATYGYYAQGVSDSTAVLPHGWQDRLVRFETPATNGVAAEKQRSIRQQIESG